MEIENSRLISHLTNEELIAKLEDVITTTFLDKGTYTPDSTPVNYMSKKTCSFLKAKHGVLMYGDLENTFKRGIAGEFNNPLSKEKLCQANIEYWFKRLADERIAARMVGRDKQHSIDKNSDKESVFTGKAVTPSGRAWAFLCKIEADLFGKYHGREFDNKLKLVDKVKQDIPFLGSKIIEAEQRHMEDQKDKISRDLMAKRRGIDLRLVNELAYKDVRAFFNI